MRTLTLLLACMATLQAAAPKQVAWTDTPAVFAGKAVVVRLTTGTIIEGHWIGITDDTFNMKVQKTSDRNAIAKGVETIPKSSIEALAFRNNRVRGRVIGTTAGYFAAGAIGFAAPEIAGVIGLAGGVIGFFVGRSSDRDLHEVVLIP